MKLSTDDPPPSPADNPPSPRRLPTKTVKLKQPEKDQYPKQTAKKQTQTTTNREDRQ